MRLNLTFTLFEELLDNYLNTLYYIQAQKRYVLTRDKVELSKIKHFEQVLLKHQSNIDAILAEIKRKAIEAAKLDSIDSSGEALIGLS